MNKESKKKVNLSKEFWILLIIICTILIVAVAVGFFYFFNRRVEVINKTKKGGNVVLNYSSDVNGLSISNAIATTDEVGMKSLTEGQYFDFSVDVDLDNASEIEYEISVAKEEETSTIKDTDIRIYLEKEKSGTYTKIFGPAAFVGLEKKTDLGSKKGSMVLTKVKKTNSTTDNYRLRMWLGSKSIVSKGKYNIEININGKAK